MPFDENQVWFGNPISPVGAQVAHRLVSASTALAAFPLAPIKELSAKLGVHEFKTTSLTGSNNDLTYIGRAAGDHNVTIAYVDPGANNAVLSVSVSSEDVSISLATGSGGAITSTAAQVKAAIEASVDASALLVVLLASGNSGAGIVTALGSTALAGPGGTLPTLDAKLECSVDGINDWYDIAATFTQKTAVGFEVGAFVRLGNFGRWSFTLGGTLPVFAVSVQASYKP